MADNEEFMYSCAGSDGYRRYGVCEADDLDGWIVYWRTLSGEKRHPVKSLGRFATVEEASEVLLVFAREKRMKRWIEVEHKGQIAGRWEAVQ